MKAPVGQRILKTLPAVTLRTACSLISLFVLTGCYERADEQMYPYVFEPVIQFEGIGTVSDLDRNGFNELISRTAHHEDGKNEAWLFIEGDGRMIDQIGIPGRVLGSPTFTDLDGDESNLEVLFGVSRNDSLFMYSYRKDTSPVMEPFFITTGKKRIDKGGSVYDWEAEAYFLTHDVTGDGEKELVTIVNSTFAGSPRGIFVHNLRTREEISRHLVGAPIGRPAFVEDLNGDGISEIGFMSGFSNHGVDEGGFSDDRGHIIIFELSRQLPIYWSYTSDIPGIKYAGGLGSFSGSSAGELIAIPLGVRSVVADNSDINIFDLKSRSITLSRRTLAFDRSIISAFIADLDGDNTQEFVILDNTNRISLYAQLQVKKSVVLDHEITGISKHPDITGDGNPEIIVWGVSDRIELLNDELKVISSSSIRLKGFKIKSLSGETLYLADSGIAHRVNYNRYYWFNRYGDEILIPLVLIGLMLGSSLVNRHRNAARTYKSLSSIRDEAEFLIYHKKKDGSYLALSGPAVSFGDPGVQLPDLASDESSNQSTASVLRTLSGKTVSCFNLNLGPGQQYLLISGRDFVLSADSWRKMTSRVAHDIRSPLTSIQLTAQRIYAESEKLDGDVRKTIQNLIERIDGRVEYLRHKSRQIMKVVGTAEAARATVGINKELSRIVGAVADTIPSDITILLKPQDGLPTITFDHDLFESVIENILVNASQAMEDGGVITIRTEMVENTALKGGAAVRNYVCVLISDTGEGIDPANLSRLFDPGYTSEEGNTGLGLTFVKQIMENHGGRVEISSEINSGTEVSLYFVVNITIPEMS